MQEGNLLDTNSIHEAALYEHRFWLQILGDHSRFIFLTLAPTESEFILTAQEFIILFDQLLELARRQLSGTELTDLNRKAYEAAYRLREFKIELLAMTLNSDLKSHLSSTFFNDMLNELEEYLFILNSLINGQNPLLHPLHYHMLWLNDAIGHSGAVSGALDLVEKDLIDKAYAYSLQFQDLYLKALTFNGYLRSQTANFPSLDRLNEQVNITMIAFTEFLDHLRDQRMDGKILGNLMPLMADHMSREECYYLWKLSLSTKNVRKPECDPGRPRLEL
jgi:hypothetical protein